MSTEKTFSPLTYTSRLSVLPIPPATTYTLGPHDEKKKKKRWKHITFNFVALPFSLSLLILNSHTTFLFCSVIKFLLVLSSSLIDSTSILSSALDDELSICFSLCSHSRMCRRATQTQHTTTTSTGCYWKLGGTQLELNSNCSLVLLRSTPLTLGIVCIFFFAVSVCVEQHSIHESSRVCLSSSPMRYELRMYAIASAEWQQEGDGNGKHREEILWSRWSTTLRKSETATSQALLLPFFPPLWTVLRSSWV